MEGLRNVKLDNKGIDIQGRPGAKARAIFNGKVAAVFKLNGLFNILIRHAAYISVYCNLSSASVKQGDTVSTKQSIGQVFSDGADGGRTVLHFQLRKERKSSIRSSGSTSKPTPHFREQRTSLPETVVCIYTSNHYPSMNKHINKFYVD